MAYIDHEKCQLCLDCGGFTDQPRCACGSSSLWNVAKLLDRETEEPLKKAS